MSIPSTAQAPPIQAPILKFPWVDIKTGILTLTAQQFIQQLFQFVVGMNRVIPCTCTHSSNNYALTSLSPSPLIKQYADYDIYAFVASATSGGISSANLVTNGSAFQSLLLYKSNGATLVGAGDIVSGSLYLAIYNNALNGGLGGLVVK